MRTVYTLRTRECGSRGTDDVARLIRDMRVRLARDGRRSCSLVVGNVLLDLLMVAGGFGD